MDSSGGYTKQKKHRKLSEACPWGPQEGVGLIGDKKPEIIPWRHSDSVLLLTLSCEGSVQAALLVTSMPSPWPQ